MNYVQNHVQEKGIFNSKWDEVLLFFVHDVMSFGDLKKKKI